MSSSIKGKRKKWKEALNGGSKKKSTLEIHFDEQSRVDFVTGFHKRKLQRQKKGHADAEEKVRQEKLTKRKELREAKEGAFGGSAQVQEMVRKIDAVASGAKLNNSQLRELNDLKKTAKKRDHTLAFDDEARQILKKARRSPDDELAVTEMSHFAELEEDSGSSEVDAEASDVSSIAGDNSEVVFDDNGDDRVVVRTSDIVHEDEAELAALARSGFSLKPRGDGKKKEKAKAKNDKKSNHRGKGKKEKAPSKKLKASMRKVGKKQALKTKPKGKGPRR
jgi:hypothetical protein